MMSLYESFGMALADFGKALGVDLVLADGHCGFTVDGEVDVEIDYVGEADEVIAWATVLPAHDDEYAAERARALLALDEIDAPNGGFSVSMDPETGRVVAHDHRPAELFDSADRVAVWVDSLVRLVMRVRIDFADRFPPSDMVEDEASDDTEDGKEA